MNCVAAFLIPVQAPRVAWVEVCCNVSVVAIRAVPLRGVVVAARL